MASVRDKLLLFLVAVFQRLYDFSGEVDGDAKQYNDDNPAEDKGVMEQSGDVLLLDRIVHKSNQGITALV